MYDGVPCSADNPDAMCYNTAKWCPDDDNCVADNGAYPFGDLPIFAGSALGGTDDVGNEMTESHSLTPFPNAIFWNWATIIILGFGNLAAIDFQARCMAAKDRNTATAACLIAGCIGLAVGIPFAYIGAVSRYYYGPDGWAAPAEFEADTCSRILDLPTCAMWLPDPMANLKLLTHEAPTFIGGWCLIGIVAASMSTSDGAILAMGTVGSHNILRNLGKLSPALSAYVTDSNLLMTTRIANLPFTLMAVLIAAFYDSDHPAGATGYLLIVAFDIVFAGCVVIIFTAFYLENPSPNAALASVLSGSIVRIILEFALPKDGMLILPFSGDEFLDYGVPTSSYFPSFFDVPEFLKWQGVDGDGAAFYSIDAQCKQDRLEDYTGLDSLIAPVVSLIVFFAVHYGEKVMGMPFRFVPEPWVTPTPFVAVASEPVAVEDVEMVDQAKTDEAPKAEEVVAVTEPPAVSESEAKEPPPAAKEEVAPEDASSCVVS